MPRIPLGTLPAFRAVARSQNLRVAAEELHLTHSAISQQIKQLEAQTGVTLFDRHGRRVALNPAGQAFARAVEPALALLEQGLRSAAAAAAGQAQPLRLTLLPSFGQRWLLPRMARWRARHPDIAIEIDASQRTVDLQAEGFHAALRQGSGPWRGLKAERLIDSPLVVLGSAAAAARLRGRATPSLADEPLLGDRETWSRWFALDGCHAPVQPVANFNDAGLMLQAAEQDIGIALARELLAADALRDGRLVRLSPLALPDERATTLWLAYPPELADWPPLVALRDWLFDELGQSLVGLPAPGARGDAPVSTSPRRRRSGSAVKATSGKAAARR